MRGTAPPARLVAAAAAGGYDALALTDRNNLYAAVPFVAEARAAGIQPILGVELDAPGPAPRPRAILLARNAAGYRSLSRLVTRRRLDPAFALAPAIANEAEGLFILGWDPELLRALRATLPRAQLAVLIEVTGQAPSDRIRLARGRALARALGIPAAASPVAAAIAPHEPELARLLAAARQGRLVTAIDAPSRPAGLPPALAIARALGAEASDLLAYGRELAAECRAELPSGWIFPPPPGAALADPFAALLERCLEGLRRRYGALAAGPMARLMRELEVIAERGFLAYFLVVGDLVAHARASGVAVVGRGSGASSIVSYALGITNVDPIAHRLHFERFLSQARADDPPDLDIDLDWRGRDHVIDYVYRAHGADRVAMISTVACFHARSAFREAARAHGIPVEEVSRLARRLPHDFAGEEAAAAGAELAACLRTSPGLAGHPWDEPPWSEIERGTAGLLGLPRHLGIHPGGIVIADRPLADLVPLERAAKGIVVTQFAMDEVEAIGLVKIDLLGNRALSTVAEAAALTGVHPGGLESVPSGSPPDPATARLLARGDTLGCFQIESPGMRHLLTMLAPGGRDDVVDALALIRPGPASSGMKERFVCRAQGLEPIAFAHPALAPVLGPTHGIPLYEEDVMGMAAAVAGIDLGAADSLRRAIAAAADPEARRALRNGFVARAVSNGVDPDRALQVWEEMARFAAYSFSRAHAAGYGVLAYQSAWLKAHHPVEFTCAVLNHHQGMYPRWLHVEDGRRHGVELALPCVNASEATFTLECAPDGGPDRGARVRTGLGQVLGLSEGAIERLLAARRRAGAFTSWWDLRRRVALATPEWQALIAVGATDRLGARTALRFELAASPKSVAVAAGIAAAGDLTSELFPAHALEPAGVALPELPRARQLHDEWRGLALSPRAHPLHFLAPAWTAALAAGGAGKAGKSGPRAIGAGTLGAHLGERVQVAGLVAATRRVPTKSGATMAFVTLDDPTGTAELTLFPAAFERARAVFGRGGPWWAIGRPEAQHGAVSLNVERLAMLFPTAHHAPV